MSQKHPGEVENFTDAFLVSAGVLLFCGLFALAAVKGFFWALVAAFGLHHVIKNIRRDT